MRAVHFGAGNIGRGFIGPMLSDSGYNVCFVGRNKSKIAQLQNRGQYPVTLANKDRDSFIVDNVTAINLNDTEDVTKAIAEAEIVTTCSWNIRFKRYCWYYRAGNRTKTYQSQEPQTSPYHCL